jgi:predicted nucleotidyltransferase
MTAPARQYPIPIPYERIARFCEKHRIRKLSLFGSVLREDFTRRSDVDVLVEFEEGATPGFEFFDMQDELGRILRRKVDLNTPHGFGPRLRKKICDQAETIFERA